MKKMFDTQKKAVVVAAVLAALLVGLGIIFSVIVITRFTIGGKQITLERAKEIALTDAGLDSSGVTFTKTKEEMERNVALYEIEFCTENTEYEYEINGNTGTIYSKSKETFAASRTEADSAAVQNSGGANSERIPGASEDIGVEQAKSIAADHAGFSVDEVQFSKSKLEHEHGNMIYEIEFYKDGMEYEYEILAESGEIVKFDSEWED